MAGASSRQETELELVRKRVAAASVAASSYRPPVHVAKHSDEEPDAGNLHVRICGSPGGAIPRGHPTAKSLPSKQRSRRTRRQSAGVRHLLPDLTHRNHTPPSPERPLQCMRSVTWAKPIVTGATYALTRRTTIRKAFLAPWHPLVIDVIEYVVAEAAPIYGNLDSPANGGHHALPP